MSFGRRDADGGESEEGDGRREREDAKSDDDTNFLLRKARILFES